MPTYEYVCLSCGYRFEVSQSMTDKPKSKCPKCKKKVKRLIGSGGGIIFKGSGFYETDYKKKTPPKTEACPKANDSCKGCPKLDK